MANYTAADVKKLRDETDAPMMECKAALEEADGDFTRAKEVLREKGKLAAGKRVGRATNAGVVAVATSADGSTISGIVLESETDFVAKNEGFLEIAQQIAEANLVEGNDAKISELAQEATAKFRENSKVSKAVRFAVTGSASSYIHFDKTKGSIVLAEGSAPEALRKIAVHIVSLPPLVVSKDQLSQEKLNHELEVEKQRAINEGKPENIAENIAKGRVNKEFIKNVVLLEQPIYFDQSKSVAQYLAEEAKGVKVTEFVYLAVGQGE